jgi:hypothetical protein
MHDEDDGDKQCSAKVDCSFVRSRDDAGDCLGGKEDGNASLFLPSTPLLTRAALCFVPPLLCPTLSIEGFLECWLW